MTLTTTIARLELQRFCKYLHLHTSTDLDTTTMEVTISDGAIGNSSIHYSVILGVVVTVATFLLVTNAAVMIFFLRRKMMSKKLNIVSDS